MTKRKIQLLEDSEIKLMYKLSQLLYPHFSKDTDCHPTTFSNGLANSSTQNTLYMKVLCEL